MPDPFEDWLKPISSAPAGLDDWASKIPDPFPDQERRMQEARVWANQQRGAEKEFGFGLGLRLRTRDLSLPFQGAANSIARGIAGVENPEVLRVRAQEAFGKGEATDEQLARLALYEYEDARNKSLGVAGAIGQGLGHAAPVVGEALVGGQAVKGIGGAIGLGTKIAPAATTSGRMLQSAGIQAAATPLTPGLWLDESQQRAAENGGNWYDPKNVAAPMVKAAFQNAIMGHLGEGTKGLGIAKRVGLGAALMPAEQAGADALTTLAEKGWKQAGMDEKWATKTEWGTIGQFMRGEKGEGWKALATQATLGGLFAGFHGQKADPVVNLGKAVDSLAKDGISQELAGRVISEAMKRPPETIKNKEVKDFVDSIIELKSVESPKTRSAEAKSEPVKSAPEAQKTAPAKPQTASQALEALFRNDAPVDPNRTPDPLPYSNIPKEAFKYEFEVTPQKSEKKKGLGVKKAAEPEKPSEPVRKSEDAQRPNLDLEDFFSKPAEPEVKKPEGPLRKNDMLEELMGMESAPPRPGAEFYDAPERRETYGEPPGGVERRRYGLRFEGSEPITEGVSPAEKHAIDKYGKENLYRVKVNDAEGKEVADAIIKEEGDTLIVPWLGKKGASSGEGKGKDIFGAREITALGKQLAEAYPDMNILKYQVGNARNAAGEQRIIDLNKYRARQAKKETANFPERPAPEAPVSQSDNPVEPPKQNQDSVSDALDEKYKREVSEMMERHAKIEKDLYEKYQKASKGKSFAEQSDAYQRYHEAQRAHGFEKHDLYQKYYGKKETANARTEEPAQLARIEQTKPVYDMTVDDLDAAIRHKEAEGKSVDEQVLGVEGAKRYNLLYKKSQSSNDAVASKAQAELDTIEASLSKADLDRLHGIGDSSPQVETMKEFRKAISDLDLDSPEALGRSLRFAITKLPKEGNDPSKMTHSEQVAFAQLRAAMEHAQRMGWDTQKISDAAVKEAGARFSDPEDAAFVLRRFIKPNQTPTPQVRNGLQPAKKLALAPRAEPAPEGTRGEEARPAEAKGLGTRKEAGVPAAAPRREVGGRVVGSDTKVKVPGTKAIDGRYEVRELRDVIASDTPGESGGFRTREDYPEGLQPRKYTGNQAEMEKVRRFAQEMDTAQYLTDDPNATGGPPTITPDGIVLNGNGRQMSLEEAARTGTYSKYKADLAAKAERFGFDPKQIEGMKEPVLYRVVNMDATSDIARDFARRGNITNTQAQTPERRAASLGGVIDDAILDSLKITGEETFAQAVNTDKGAKFRSKLREKLPPNVVEEFFNPDDTLTDAGKVFVGDMLATKVVPIEVLERIKGINKNLANAIESAAPQLIALNRNTKVNPVPALNEALDFLSKNPEITDMSGVSNALDQRDIFGKTQTISPAGRMMVDFVMQTAGQGRTKVFRERLVEMAGDLSGVGKSNLFGDVGPKLNETEKIAEVLGVKPRVGAKFLPKEPEGFGRTMTPEERDAGQVGGGSPLADELPRMDGGLKELALANENVDAERVRNGLQPLMSRARAKFGEVWDQAMAKLGMDPNLSADLVSGLEKKMRNISPEESALLLHRRIQFSNEYERTIRQANAAAMKNDWNGFERFDNRAKELLEQMNRLDRVMRDVGTEAGRTLAFRRQLAAEDFSLTRMMGEMTRAKKGALTPEEMQKVQDQADRIQKLEERLRDFERKEAEEADVIDLQPAEQPGMIQRVKEWLGSLFPRQRPTLGAAKRGKVWDFADRMEKEAASELKAKFGSGNLFSNPMFDPSTIASLSKYTAAKIIKSGLTFADFSSQIIARFGDAVKPHLKEIWDGAQKHVEVGKMDKVDTQVELKKTKAEVMEDRAKFERKNQSVGRKLWEGTKETNNLMRAIQTAWDVSAVGRQGVVLSLTHPTKVPAAVREMVQSIRSERGYERNQQEILNRRNALDYQLSELEFTDHHADPTKQEESLMGRYVQKLPGLAASSRAFNGYLNRLRADVFDAMTLNSTSTGPARMAELKAAANWINAVTGRGKTGYKRIDDATAHLAQVFFSPRHALSRFQVLSGQPFWGAGTWKAKKMIAKEYAKYAIGMGAVYGLAKLALGDEAEIEKDSRSSDFGKIKIGKTRIDPLAGFSQSAVVSHRLLWGEMKAAGSNEVKDLRGPGHKFKDPTSIDVAGRFIRNKLSPLGGEVSDKLFPEFTPPGVGPLTDATGRKKGLGGWAIRQADKFQPLTAGDIYDAFKEHGIPRATALSLLNLLGWGTQVHERQPKAK